jgi:arabinogalactan oligomer/maltooligosaccharide transport system substrate-binding protein
LEEEFDPMNRRSRLAALLAVVAIIAAACSTGGGSAAPSAAAPSAAAPSAGGASAAPASDAPLAYQGEITFWNTMRDFELAEVQKLVDAWTAEHPGITVKMDPTPFDGADVAYANAAAGQTAPDIFRSDVGWVSGFANQGFLLPLDGLVGDTSDFLAAPLQTGQYDGKQYGLPQVTDALGLLCNKSVLTEAGLTAAPTTWADLVAKGTGVTDLSAQDYGFYMRGDSYWSQPYIWGWGGTLFEVNDQGLVTVTVDSPESAAGWSYLKDSILGTVAPATWDFASDYDNMNAGFKAGTTMCILQGPWQVADILEGEAFKADPSNLVISPVPDGDAGTGSPIGGHDYVVYALVAEDPDKQAAVISLLNHIDSTESQVALADSLGLLPTRTSAYAAPSVADNEIIAAWQAVLAKATNRSGVPGAQNIYASFSENFQAFLTGSKTVDQALADTATDWETNVFPDFLAPQ